MIATYYKATYSQGSTTYTTAKFFNEFYYVGSNKTALINPLYNESLPFSPSGFVFHTNDPSYTCMPPPKNYLFECQVLSVTAEVFYGIFGSD
jgi:hypothetical protein